AQERRRAAPLLAASAAPTAGAALLYRQLADVQLAPAVLPGLLWLAGLWAGSVLAGLLLCRGLSAGGLGPRKFAPVAAESSSPGPVRGKLVEHTGDGSSQGNAPGAASDALPAKGYRPRIVLILSAALYIIACAAVLSRAGVRLAGEAETMSARQLMYHDAWGLFMSAPWLGHGGDTWRMSYRSIQSQPYVGAEVHSGYMDLLLNIGAIGLLIVLLSLFLTAIRLKSACPSLLPAFSVLLIHSIIDFDWSYGLVWLLMLWLAAMGTARAALNKPGHPLAVRVSSRVMKGIRTRFSACVFDQGFTVRMTWLGRRILFITGVACLTVWTALVSSYWLGDRYFEQAIFTVDEGKRKQLLESSIRWNPASPETALLLAEQLPPMEAAEVLKRGLVRSPGHPALIWGMAELHALSGNAEQAAIWYQISVEKDRYHTGKQTQAILSLVRLARNEWALGRSESALTTAYSAINAYDAYHQTAKAVTENPFARNDRDFRMSPQAERVARDLKQRIEKIHLDAYQNAISVPVFLIPNTTLQEEMSSLPL
ncbi:O-antigen ligase family protein, partial [Paenibacillus faecalis]|uniref:O-antigen ligase family protein n=1 Tax=Paenibacillus faecalis TaxID=2079532 RepID=UPI0018F8A9F5